MVSSSGLFLLCGIFVATLGWASSTDFISHNMKEDIRKIKEHFKTNDKSLFRDPIFLNDLKNLESKFEEAEQKLILGEILEVYLNILSHMVNGTKDAAAQQSLSHTVSRLDTLKKHYYPNTGPLKAHLQDIWAIDPDDLLVQRKAIQELMPVFHRASVLGHKAQLPRDHFQRRRQTRSSWM